MVPQIQESVGWPSYNAFVTWHVYAFLKKVNTELYVCLFMTYKSSWLENNLLLL